MSISNLQRNRFAISDMGSDGSCDPSVTRVTPWHLTIANSKRLLIAPVAVGHAGLHNARGKCALEGQDCA